jgi:hypothetical protein
MKVCFAQELHFHGVLIFYLILIYLFWSVSGDTTSVSPLLEDLAQRHPSSRSSITVSEVLSVSFLRRSRVVMSLRLSARSVATFITARPQSPCYVPELLRLHRLDYNSLNPCSPTNLFSFHLSWISLAI